MNLKEFKPIGETDYSFRARRNFAIGFLSKLKIDNNINRKQTEDIIKIGEDVYQTTFTDDSGYIEGGMNLSSLDNLINEIRNKVIDYLYLKGNYIVKHHVLDYLKQRGLETELNIF